MRKQFLIEGLDLAGTRLEHPIAQEISLIGGLKEQTAAVEKGKPAPRLGRICWMVTGLQEEAS
ncbi:hypothetical protein ABS71_21615 [bacterium SCN 62-11]|nr:MAG: hypothetical protein ABS71_21615 [bacterium SCN 62-11]